MSCLLVVLSLLCSAQAPRALPAGPPPPPPRPQAQEARQPAEKAPRETKEPAVKGPGGGHTPGRSRERQPEPSTQGERTAHHLTTQSITQEHA